MFALLHEFEVLTMGETFLAISGLMLPVIGFVLFILILLFLVSPLLRHSVKMMRLIFLLLGLFVAIILGLVIAFTFFPGAVSI